jgi:ethanolamine utilization protein EutS
MAAEIQQEKKQRVVQEYVPGKQITLAHLIANPVKDLSKKLGLAQEGTTGENAIGILTITPSEASIIAADVATKSAAVRIGFVDRFSGSLVIVGDVAAVEAALRSVLDLLAGKMQFTPTVITRS